MHVLDAGADISIQISTNFEMFLRDFQHRTWSADEKSFAVQPKKPDLRSGLYLWVCFFLIQACDIKKNRLSPKSLS